MGGLKFSQIIWNCLKCLYGFSPGNPLNFGKAFRRLVLSSHSSSGYCMLLFMVVLLDVANSLMLLSAIMFGFGLGER